MDEIINPELTSQLCTLVRNDDVEGISLLLDAGQDIPGSCEDVDGDGWSAFTLAADLGRLHIIDHFLNAKVCVNNKSYIRGWRALHAAACNGHLDVVHRLLQAEADVNVGDEEDWSPLHYAADKGLTELCSALIDNGAELNGQTLEGYSALYVACQAGQD